MESKYLKISISIFIFILLCFFLNIFDISSTYDYLNYSEWFSNISNNLSNYYIYKDPFFYLISKVVLFVDGGVNNVLLTLVLISIFCKLWFAYKLPVNIFFIFLWLYFCRLFFIHDLIQFRIAVGTGFGLLFFINYIDDNKGRAFIFILLALSIHLSTLLYLIVVPLYKFVNKNTISKKAIFLVVASFFISIYLGGNNIGLIAIFKSIPILYSRMAPYIDGSYAYTTLSLVNGYLYIKITFYIMFVAMFIYNKKNIDTYFYLLFLISIVNTDLFLIFRWNDSIALRISDALSVFDLLFISFFLNKYRDKLLITMIIFIVGLIMLHSSVKV
ncbi:EpsG family protein [Photobacterium damselae]|uniref:EpsG family protein n=1 Tax=Photobacterium damselae TaxID=38293 RepID=UPI00370CF88C